MQFTTKDVDIPKAFTSIKEYQKWFKALSNKCSNTIGSCKFIIDYLLCNPTQKPSNQDLEMAIVQERFYWLAPYARPAFQEGSKRLWSFIQ